MNECTKLCHAGVKSALLLFACLLFHGNALAQLKPITEDIQVVVKEGEYLTAIVKRVMGSVEFWPEVALLNKIKSPDALKPGDTVTFPGSMVQERNYATVRFTKGNVTIKGPSKNTESPLVKGVKVYLGDVIQTGTDGFVSLSFNGESLINIQPESHIQIIEFDCYDKELACIVHLSSDIGQMSFDVRNVGFKLPTRFSIDTPYASAAVRGTEFDITISEDSGIGVTEGSVVMSSGNVSSDLPLGKGALAGPGRSVATIYDLLDKPVHDKFIRFSAEDYVTWSVVDDAETYKVLIAGNESLTDVIRSVSTGNTYAGLLPDSQRYYLSIRALDENGLIGFREVKRIEQMSISDGAVAPELEIELSGNDLKIVNKSKLNAEVHVGSKLELIDGEERLLRYNAHDIAAGKPLSLVVDSGKDIYISSRAIVSESAVSPYGSIYEFKRQK